MSGEQTRRRGLRFSLASLMVALTICGIGLGLYANRPYKLLDGYCPVTLQESNTWVLGRPRYTTVFMGARYYFAGEAERDRFIENPGKYAAAFQGHDVVVAHNEGKLVLGDRRHGLIFRKKVYLFASEESLHSFWIAPARYVEPLAEAEPQRRSDGAE